MKRFLAAALCLTVGHLALAQFNCDLDEPTLPPEGGGGAPSSAFGAAANQSGYWNALLATGFNPTQLRDVTGTLTQVTCYEQPGGTGGGNNFTGNTGDFARLLNDGGQSGPNFYVFSNVPDGAYQAYVYAVQPDNVINPTLVTIGSAHGTVTGPMPNNQFILGVTHVVLPVTVTNGTFTIEVDTGSVHSGWVNGFQIVPVPEPASLLALAGGLGLVLRRRRSVW